MESRRLFYIVMRFTGAVGLVVVFAFLASIAVTEARAELPATSDPSVSIALSSAPSASSQAPSEAGESREVYQETGTASWYGLELDGKRTASGEIFDRNRFSAAHRTLPLGTAIRVTNLDNDKSIQVRVNDRGPFVRNRVIDLSYGAAKELNFVAQGTARVKIEALEPIQDSGQYTVQAAIFTEMENARLLKDRLSKKFELITIVPFESSAGKFYRVRVGTYSSEEKAEQIAGKLLLEGLEPTVVRKD